MTPVEPEPRGVFEPGARVGGGRQFTAGAGLRFAPYFEVDLSISMIWVPPRYFLVE
jgi:hypothetical protein